MRVLHIKLCKIGLQQGGWGLFGLQSRVFFLKAQNPTKQRHLRKNRGAQTQDCERSKAPRSSVVCPEVGGATAVVRTLREFPVPLGQRKHFGSLPDSLPGCSSIPNQGIGERGHLQNQEKD